MTPGPQPPPVPPGLLLGHLCGLHSVFCGLISTRPMQGYQHPKSGCHGPQICGPEKDWIQTDNAVHGSPEEVLTP